MVKNYLLAKIYKMVSPSGLIYIGSTCEPTLARRKSGHKRMFKFYCKSNKKYYSSFLLFEEDKDNVNIILLENYPCNNRDELTAREGYYIKQFDCVNRYIAGRNKKQYNIDKSDIINAPNECVCGGRFTYKNSSQHIKSIKHEKFIQKQPE
jgi:hypothetical protein